MKCLQGTLLFPCLPLNSPMTVRARASIGSGEVTFRPTSNGLDIHIHTCLLNLNDGPHGFHIHESSDTTHGCASMGGHWNPHGHVHGDLTDPIRHQGDLGNVMSHRGCIDQSISLPGVRVEDVIGRGIVLHQDEDDLGRGSTKDSQQTGSAGARFACAPIVQDQRIT